MKKLLLILAIMTSGVSFAQTKIQAVEGIIELTPDKVVIPSTNEYVYLAKTKGGYSLFISKNVELYTRFSTKGNDSLIILQGAVFKPLQHYSKKQWKKLKKEIKIVFPLISQKELEKLDMYLIFNYSVEFNDPYQPEESVTPQNSSSNGKTKVEIDPLTGRPKR